jgi:hypothetical protein
MNSESWGPSAPKIPEKSTPPDVYNWATFKLCVDLILRHSNQKIRLCVSWLPCEDWGQWPGGHSDTGIRPSSPQRVTTCSWPTRKTASPFDCAPSSGSPCNVYTTGGRDATERLYIAEECGRRTVVLGQFGWEHEYGKQGASRIVRLYCDLYWTFYSLSGCNKACGESRYSALVIVAKGIHPSTTYLRWPNPLRHHQAGISLHLIHYFGCNVFNLF